MLLHKIDAYGKAGWLAVLLTALWLAWPAALIVVAYLAASGRLQEWRTDTIAPGTWFNLRTSGNVSDRVRKWSGFSSASSGNQAFDEYREATIRGLEEEQHEFASFLDHLRNARDKAEFEMFMTERRQRSPAPDGPAPLATI